VSLAPLLNAAPPIALHAFAAMTAFALGLVQFAAPKGTLPHRTIGWIWVLLIVTVAISSFWIHQIRLLGPFSPIHLLSIFTLVQFLVNQFGFDRDGFRALVLSPAERRLLLLGKNLAALPVGIAFGGTLLVLTSVWLRLSPIIVVAGFFQLSATLLLAGLGGNVAAYIKGSTDVVFTGGVKNVMTQTLVAGGPEDLSPLEVVQIFEEATGGPFERQFVPEEALLAQLETAADPLSETFAKLQLECVHGCLMSNAETLRLMPMDLTSVRQYARTVAERKGAAV
jgi:uncharacterized membrane protein